MSDVSSMEHYPHTPPSTDSRVAPLDGLRAVSVSLVLLGHLSGTAGFPSLTFEHWVGDYANLGVLTFFVISGFLITRLLLVEQAKTAKISLPLFYARRIVRLFPAFLLFISCVIVANMLGWIRLRPGDMTAALTYTVNFRRNTSWYVGHLWSLSVEEQFYLLWPAALMLLGCARSVWAAAAVILLAPIARLVSLYQHVPGSIFPCVADSLACGCLLAMCGDALLRRSWYRRFLTSPWTLPLLALIALVCNRSRVYALGIAVGVSILNLALTLLVHHCVSSRSVVTKFLAMRPLVWIGVLSYSLYLWQQVFLNRSCATLLASFPWNVGSAFVVACASYYCVERPLNGFRRRLQAKATCSRPVQEHQQAAANSTDILDSLAS